ncbi:hypothetical protein NL676_016949 [Syzygium grande]|nr:hypothetical protein NL676_016949 [Syzygium grande]
MPSRSLLMPLWIVRLWLLPSMALPFNPPCPAFRQQSRLPPCLRLLLLLQFLRSFDLWRLCPSALPFSGLRPPAPKKEEAGSSSDSESDDDDAGRAGAVPGSTAEYEITEERRPVWERHEKAMQDLMMKRCGAALAVPTNDKAVHAHLRRLGELMTLFGEREMERRDQL